MTRLIGFKIVFTLITLMLLLFQIIVWKKIRPLLENRRYFAPARAFYFGVVFAGQSILWIGVFYPGRGPESGFPDWYLPVHKTLLAINYSHAFWMLPISLIWLLGMVVKRVLTLTPRPSLPKGEGEESRFPSPSGRGVALAGVRESEVLPRSEFLRRAGGLAAAGLNLIPMATSAAAISGMFRGSKEIWVNEKPIRIASLHDDLKGLRLVQISDIHIGNLIHEKYLNFALGLIRAAKPDYILVTGDIIDNNNAFLPVAGRFFAALNTAFPGRIFGCMGNHDYIHDGDRAASGLNAAGLKILMNDAVKIGRGRGRLQLGGLDYPGVPIGRGPVGKKGRFEAMRHFFAETAKKLKPDMPLILMNHHPSDFEYLKTQPLIGAGRRIDLVLSGHTHGGQIRFSDDRNSLLNGATWLYKYYVDHYEENGAQLYVNRGLGHWFPLRVDCPPEITVFTIT